MATRDVRQPAAGGGPPTAGVPAPVGRETEIAVISSRMSQPGLTMVIGAGGMGKTAVVRAAAGRAGARLFEAGGLPALQWMPALPLRRAFRVPVPADDVTASAAFVGALLADGVLHLDDAQWADAFTIAVANVVALRHPVVVSARPGAVTRRFKDLGAERVSLVELSPLDPAYAAAMVRSVAPHLAEERVADIVANAGGYPFLLENLALGRGDSLREAVAVRLAALSPSARTALLVIALLGRPAPPALMGAGHDELEEAGFVRRTGHAVEPAFATLFDLVPSLVGNEHRLAVHRRLARAVTDAGEAARHHLAAGEPDEAVGRAVQAASAARDAHERAHHLMFAAEHARGTRAAQLWHQAAEAFRDAGNTEQAENSARRATASANATSLTRREREVLTLVAGGATTASAARTLRVSAETVESHVKSAMRKLGARTRTEAVVLAAQSE